MTTYVAKNICENIGEVVQSIGAKTEEGGSFIRVRIKIDLLLPLCKGRIATLENGEKSWVSFNFKHLPNLYYWCGRLTHGDKDCSLWIQSRGTLKAEQK